MILRGPAGRRAFAAACVCGALLLAAPAPAAERLPLRLVDPATGEPVVLDKARGLTHVVFLAVWCRPCVDELPALADFEARWGAGGYRLVLVAVPTRHDAQRLAEFSREHAVPGRLLFDPKGEAVKAFGIDKLPAHVVLDEGGAVVLSAPQFDEALREGIASRVRSARGEAAR